MTASGQVKHFKELGKGWPYDTSMNRPDLVRGPEPWAPPLTNIYPKDWPSQNEEEIKSIQKKNIIHGHHQEGQALRMMIF